ncbi:hypothetical protein [Caniella muris]|uniref:hypothetical protein n=1 Tax=Caniella muris TaxID=2941502 RepID=UPI002042283F|nr:hypothetical protein [Caniella muris]
MSILLSMELRKAFGGAPFKIALGVGTLLALVSAGTFVFWFSGYVVGDDGSVVNLGVYEIAVPDEYYGMLSLNSPFYACMSRDNTVPASTLFFVLAPLLCLLPYAWSYRSELTDGYLAQVYVRTFRAPYYRAKAAAVFLSAFVAVIVPQVVNFIVLCCIYPLYTPTPVDSFYTGISNGSPWSQLYYSAPLLYVSIYFLVSSILAGVWSTFVLSLSFFISNRVVLLVGPFLAMRLLSAAWVMVLSAQGVWGPELGLSELMRMASDGYHLNPWIMLGECLLLALVSIFISRRQLRGDVV